MNKLILLPVFITMFFVSFVKAQAIHPRNVKDTTTYRVYLSSGLDFGVTTTGGLLYKFQFDGLTLSGGAEIDFPAGDRLTDDYKIALPLEGWLFPAEHFALSIAIKQEFRQTKNWAYTHINFGNEFAMHAYCSRNIWFAGTEVSYDRAWLTHIRHSAAYRDGYPEAKSGWYSTTAGNFKLGLLTGVSLNGFGLAVSGGIVKDENFFDEFDPSIPFYALLHIYRVF
jgi:hypothetical protein